jgi:hypothetical protein
MTSIDGSCVVRGHGDKTMPVWGEVFEKEAEVAKVSKTHVSSQIQSYR